VSTITLDEIQRDLLGYLRRVQAGETLVIVQAEQPIAELKPIPSSPPQPRPAGLCAGEFETAADFDAPLPEEIVRQFEGR
jgi:antitoxin (DNA-binding transcriptional repressor) of toxin-antitoxin stability system